MEIEKVKKIKSRVSRKTRKGGMSAKRYSRLRQEALESFYKKAGETLNKDLLPIINEVDHIILGGNPIRADEFLKKGNLDYRLLKKVHPEKISVSCIDETGLEQAKKEVARILTNHELAKELKIWNKFMSLLMKGDSKAIYGSTEVRGAIQDCKVDLLLITENNWFITRPYEHDFIEGWINGCPPKDTVIFSKETEWGQQLKAFGGVAAILKY